MDRAINPFRPPFPASLQRRIGAAADGHEPEGNVLQPVTVDEFVLFARKSASIGRQHLPDHWSTFEVSDGRTPIQGVRAEDAIAFCEWLTAIAARYGRAASFSLPNCSHAARIGRDLQLSGIWCHGSGGAEILALQPEVVSETLNRVRGFIKDRAYSDMSGDFDLPLHLGDTDVQRDSALERIRNRERTAPHFLRLEKRIDALRDNFVWRAPLDDWRSSAHKLVKSVTPSAQSCRDVKMFHALGRDLDWSLQHVNTLRLSSAYILCVYLICDVLACEILSVSPRQRKVAELRSRLDELAETTFGLYAYFMLIRSRIEGITQPWDYLVITSQD